MSVADGAAERAFRELRALEGIIPALETAHALAWVTQAGRREDIEAPVAICLSGPGGQGRGACFAAGRTGGRVVPQGRIAARFAGLAAEGRAGFIPYVTAGYPTLDHTRDLLAGLAELEADVIELGIPFSDPMADGPTIQRSSQGALEGGTTVDDVFAALAELRRASQVPVVLFSYLNPVYARGVGTFVSEAAEAADGILPTDLPLGADPALEARLLESPLDFVRLVAPTTRPEWVRCARCRPYPWLRGSGSRRPGTLARGGLRRGVGRQRPGRPARRGGVDGALALAGGLRQALDEVGPYARHG